MFVVKKSRHNPLLVPTKENLWESVAAFNWCPIEGNMKEKSAGKTKLAKSNTKTSGKTNYTRCVYRAMGPAESAGLTAGPEHVSVVGFAESKDGIHFENRRKLIEPELLWEQYGCEDPRVTFFEGKYYIFYTALSNFPFNADGIKVAVAITRDFKTIDEKHLVTPFNAKAMVLFPERVNGKIAVALTVNTDRPPAKIAFAYFDRIEDLWNEKIWTAWYAKLNGDGTNGGNNGGTNALNVLDVRRFPSDHTEIGAPPIKTKKGWLFIYSHIQHYFDNQQKVFGIEALLLDLKNPEMIIGKTKGPIVAPEEIYEEYGFVPGVTFPSGGFIRGDELEIYYGAADTTCARAHVNLDDLLASMIPTEADKLVIRSGNNPILKPIGESWEAKAVFNPAAIDIGGKVRILYRAMSNDNTSTVGYAESSDGINIDMRLPEPIYVPREPFEMKRVPGGNSGCEDARIVQIAERLYLTYTAYDGVDMPAIAVSSISVKDFTAKKWNWDKPYVISPIQIDDKDSSFFPEKIKTATGLKYMIFHRVGANICADFFKTLDFKNEKINKCVEILRPRPGMWDERKIGISAPPIKTKKGWLLIYHGISDRSIYRVGAALLDLKDPTEVIARTTDALLSPEMDYELKGQVNNVVFPCGAVIRKDTVFIYYGGADSVTGVATLSLSKLLSVLSN
jgi:predicted GH43/DUF377 family glycosyl hydrolase